MGAPGSQLAFLFSIVALAMPRCYFSSKPTPNREPGKVGVVPLPHLTASVPTSRMIFLQNTLLKELRLGTGGDLSRRPVLLQAGRGGGHFNPDPASLYRSIVNPLCQSGTVQIKSLRVLGRRT